jgi:hypothetical protein
MSLVPGTVSTQEAMVLPLVPLLSTHDNVQLVAVHSPATAKNLRKMRKPRKKVLHIASPKTHQQESCNGRAYCTLVR